MQEVKRVFTVDGKPFFPVSGQAHNDAGYNDNESEYFFKTIKLVHGNSLTIPVYWLQVEPEEGKFDFTSVDALLATARRYDVHLILLWFGTWKNTNMDYTPAWVKNNPKRFKRVMTPNGSDLWVLSPHCKANQEADKKVFNALCKHLKAKDSKEHTVIGIQLENESGILGCDRDYNPEFQDLFDGPVPAKLISSMKAAGKGDVYNIWQQAGGKQSGKWSEVFGWPAGEFMTAYSIATYIDGVAKAGKAAYDVPMYINVWLMEADLAVAGETYPSGGAVTKTLDIFKWFTPHVDMISPDLEYNNTMRYQKLCAAYSRPDNPLFFPETPPTTNLFRAIADYNLVGYSWMGGFDHIMGDNGAIRPEMQDVVNTVHCIVSAIPLILKYQGTDKIHAIVQEEYMPTQYVDLDGYLGQVQFGQGRMSSFKTDWRHVKDGGMPKEQADVDIKPEYKRGRGLLFQTSKNEFYLAGIGWRLFLRPKVAPEKRIPLYYYDDIQRSVGRARQISVDEGHFDQNGKFVVDRQRNKTPLTFGAWVEADIGVLRIIMCDA
jgi:hypothetical protein